MDAERYDFADRSSGDRGPKQNPREASRAGVVVVRDDPWVLLYIPALDRLLWVDLARVPDRGEGRTA